jgi:glycosyltransferase involved in cell wall biosynthesis
MHVILIHQAFSPPQQPGGTRHYELLRPLVQAGHSVTVVASNLVYRTGQPAVKQRRLVSRHDLEGITVLRAYTYPSLHRSFAWRVFSFISFMLTSTYAALRAGPADLIMGTSPPIFQAASAWLVAWLRHRPFLLEVRDLWPEFAIDLGVLTNPVLIVLSRRLERFLYARATHILVNSPAYRDYLQARDIAADKITLIPNGVDPSMFDPAARGEIFREEWDLAEDFVVTYAGALGLANDIPTVLKAAQRLNDRTDIRFLLVGDGKDRPKLEAMSSVMGLRNVIFTGIVPKSRMPQVLAASDACVASLKNIPMFRTTYPNKVFDYMAAGRPTILAIDGVIREVMEAASGGIFVPPGDDEELAQAVLSLYDDRSRARTFGDAARDYVVAHFDRSRHVEMFAALLERLTGRE